MEELLGGLEDALAGHGRLFLLAGEPGIGKSRLADELGLRATERDAHVLWGRCWEAGGAPAYWPWVQSLRTYLREQDPDLVREQLGAGAAELVQMLPEIRQIIPLLTAPPSEDPEAARFRLFDATTAFLKAASQRTPIVFILDDLHVADAPSLLLLQFLADELGETHVMVLGGYRDTDITPIRPIRAALPELVRRPVTRRLELGGLSREEVARFVEGAIGASPDAGLVSAVHRETDGNPLFVGEITRLLAAEGRLGTGAPHFWRLTIPQGVREAIARRLEHLSDACNRVLALASVLGREFDLGVLQRVSKLPGDELLRILEEATEARVLIEVPDVLGRLRFFHSLVRDALYEELPATRRSRLHRQVAEALEEAYDTDASSHLAELAHHFFEAAPAGEANRAVGYSRRAAERAKALLAYEEAVRLYEMALQALRFVERVEERTRCELVLGLGDARARAGDMPAAREAFREAADLAKRLGLQDLLARAALGYGGRFVWARAGDDPHLIPLLEDALAAVGERDSALRARLLARLAGALRDQPSREPRASLSQEAVEIAGRVGDPGTLAYTLDGRYSANQWPENSEERLGIATEVVRVAHEAGERERALQGHHWRLIALLELGRPREARIELEAKARLAEEIRQPAQLWFVDVIRAKLALFEGSFDQAEELIASARGYGHRSQSREAEAAFQIQTYTLRRERDSVEDLVDVIRRSVAEYPGWPVFRCLLTLVYAQSGREAGGRELFLDLARDGFAALYRDNEWLLGMAFLTEACAIFKDRARAVVLYDQLTPFAHLNIVAPSEVAYGSVSRYLGLLATVLGRWNDAARHFDDALERNERMGARPWAAHTRHDYARMLLARDAPGDRERGTELLVAARESCEELGMSALGVKVGSTLDEIGAPREAGPATAPRPAIFRRDGDYWSVAFAGDAFRLKDVKGFRYLARLVAEPGREFHVLDLVAQEEGVEPRRRSREPGHQATRLGDAGAILDAQAKASFRTRLADLNAEIEEARGFGDEERASRAEEERAFLARELSGAVGLGGRDRKAASAPERARVAVTKAIRNALAKIHHNSPPLGDHFERTIKTGTYCSYVPSPRDPVTWQL